MLSRAPQYILIEELNHSDLLDIEASEFENEEYQGLIKTAEENSEKHSDLKILDGRGRF